MTGATNDAAYRSSSPTKAVALMYSSGAGGRYCQPGSRVIQFGVSRCRESHRSLRQRSTDAATLQHDVLVPRGGQQIAHGQPSVTGTYDNRVCKLHDDLAFFRTSCRRPCGRLRRPPGPGLQSAGHHVDGDGRRIGEHVIHGGAPARLFDDPAEGLVISVALDVERDLDLLVAVTDRTIGQPEDAQQVDVALNG